MEPTLSDGDLLFVLNPRWGARRGQIVVAEMRAASGPRWRVKRIVGLPGESLTFEDGLLFINGTHHAEPYLRGLPAYLGLDSMRFEVGDHHYFLLGDNRAHSDDSRSFGSIEDVSIVGIVACRLWPAFRRSKRS